jgi:hypothetical protein
MNGREAAAGVKNAKKPINRANKTRRQVRETLQKLNLARTLFSCMQHFFPDLVPMLRSVFDRRDDRYTTYDIHIILFTRIMFAVVSAASMRAGSEELNSDEAIENIRKILGLDELVELPHWPAINNCLKRVDPKELEGILQEIARRLIKSKSLDEGSKIRGNYWQVIIDGTHLATFKERHCKHCLTKKHKTKDGEDVEYYRTVLEAKIVFMGDVAISIGTEFIENEDEIEEIGGEPLSKQDCEIKAFKRLAADLKKEFPRPPICATMDSLYANESVFKICESYGWRFIIRFKDGSIKTFAEDFHALKDMKPERSFTAYNENTGERETYKCVSRLRFKKRRLDVAELVLVRKSGEAATFVFVTDMSVAVDNCRQFVEDGRRRRKIENQGFDVQKHHGYNLEHMFCYNYTAMKNHYLLTQIGHAISQLFEKRIFIAEGLKLAIAELHRLVLENVRRFVLTDEDIEFINKRKHIPLKPKPKST